MAEVFQGVELYRSLENLLYKDRAWCDANKGGSTVYQKWDGYPDSPMSITSYPYQMITNYGTDYYLLLFISPIRRYINLSEFYDGDNIANTKLYLLTNGNWVFLEDITTIVTDHVIQQANNDVYTNDTLTTILFAKTTASSSGISPLIYSGTGEAFSDTGLSGNTQYYYKIFAKYLDGAVTSYSDGVMVSGLTEEL